MGNSKPQRDRNGHDKRVQGHSYPQEWYEHAIGKLLERSVQSESAIWHGALAHRQVLRDAREKGGSPSARPMGLHR